MQRQEAGHCRYDSARLGDIAGTEGRAIEDEGDIFVELASLLEGAETLQMLVLSGHQFHNLTLPAAFPESITTLVFDGIAWIASCKR